MALTLTGGKGKGKGKGRFQPYQGAQTGRLMSLLEDREWRELERDWKTEQEKIEREKREQREKDAEKRKKDKEDTLKRQEELAEKQTKAMEKAVLSIAEREEIREKKRAEQQEANDRAVATRIADQERKKLEQELEQERAELRKERARLEKEKASAITPAKKGGKTKITPQKEPQADESDEEEEEEEKTADSSWKDSFRNSRKSAMRKQRVKAPIEMEEWIDWEATTANVKEVCKQLKLKNVKPQELKGNDILELATELAKKFSDKPLKAVHKRIVKGEPKARWSKEDTMVSIIAHIVDSE